VDFPDKTDRIAVYAFGELEPVIEPALKTYAHRFDYAIWHYLA